MWNVCWNCGLYRADKTIDPNGPVAICPECGYRHPFRQLPLLLVSGASGVGKSAVCQALLGQLPEVVLLDTDILWRPEFNTPDTHYQAFFDTWLRMCKNIGQAGRPVVLFGAGVGVPTNLEACVERRYLGHLHFLALSCEDEALMARLQHRPTWRQSRSPEYLTEHVRFNQWFKAQARHSSAAIDLIDTTDAPIAQSALEVAAWIRARIAA